MELPDTTIVNIKLMKEDVNFILYDINDKIALYNDNESLRQNPIMLEKIINYYKNLYDRINKQILQ